MSYRFHVSFRGRTLALVVNQDNPLSQHLTNSAIDLRLSVSVNFEEYKNKKLHFRNDKLTNCITETLKKSIKL